MTVPNTRQIEREFWNAFRSECDIVFNYRKKQQEAYKKELQTYLQSKVALCEQAEILINSEQRAIKIRPQLQQLKEEWNTIKADWNSLDKHHKKTKTTEAVDDRFEKACQQVERYYQIQQAAEQRQQLNLLKQKADFCVEIEQTETFLPSQQQDKSNWLTMTQAAWEKHPKLENTELEALIEQRFQQACAAVLTEKQKTDRETLKKKQTLCIRMEILAGIESPSEAAQTRLAHQVARLSAAMREGEKASLEPQAEAQKIEQSWYLSGAVSKEQAANLEQRFGNACHAFYLRYQN